METHFSNTPSVSTVNKTFMSRRIKPAQHSRGNVASTSLVWVQAGVVPFIFLNSTTSPSRFLKLCFETTYMYPDIFGLLKDFFGSPSGLNKVRNDWFNHLWIVKRQDVSKLSALDHLCFYLCVISMSRPLRFIFCFFQNIGNLAITSVKPSPLPEIHTCYGNITTDIAAEWTVYQISEELLNLLQCSRYHQISELGLKHLLVVWPDWPDAGLQTEIRPQLPVKETRLGLI